MLNNVYACCSTFVQLYNGKYGRTTYLLMATWFASVFVFHGLTIYISEYSKAVEANYYNRLTVSMGMTKKKLKSFLFMLNNLTLNVEN